MNRYRFKKMMKAIMIHHVEKIHHKAKGEMKAVELKEVITSN